MPKSKKQGGKYFLDKGLLAITGDFTSYGGTMRTGRLDEDQTKKAIKYLLQMDGTRLRKRGDSGRQYSLKRTKEISNTAPSEISDEQEKQIREAYDYVMTGEPVARLTGQEFQKDGTPLTEKVTRFYQERYNGKAVHPELGEVKLDLEGGYEAASAIRKLPGGDRLKILAFSANAFEEDKEKSRQAGMDGHIAKPLKIDALLNELKRFSV